MVFLPYALDKYQRGKKELKEDMSETAFGMWQRGEFSKGYKTPWEMMEEDGEGEKKGYRMRTFVKWMNYIKEIFQLEGMVRGAYDWGNAGDLSVVDVSHLFEPSS